MRILIISDSYPPEVRSASLLMYELAQALIELKHDVTVLTSYPRYNLAEETRTYPLLEDDHGVKVLRIKTPPIHNINFILRGLNQLLLPIVFYLTAKKNIKNNLDVILVYSPPLTLGLTGIMLKRKNKTRMVFNVQDIFPQNAIDLGVLKNSYLIKLFEAMENYIYRHSDLITVHSEGNKEYILNKKEINRKKVAVVHNWIDPEPFMQELFTENYIKAFNLNDKFVILFAGVIGYSQGLEFIIEAADNLKHLTGIMFLVVGDGMAKKELIHQAQEKNLTNIVFHDFVSTDQYPSLVNSIDVGLVCLSSKNKTPVVPGKLLGFMAAGKPVIAALNEESDGHQIISEAGCGYSVIHGDMDGFLRAINKIYDNRNNKQVGLNGRMYLLENFTKDICVSQYNDMFNAFNTNS